jgi:hypothetical protein
MGVEKMDRKWLKGELEHAEAAMASYGRIVDRIKEELKERPNLKDGDPVVVWGYGSERRNRYFKEWDEDGRIVCWRNGSNRWSCDYDSSDMPWDNYELPEEFEKVIY